MQKFNFHRISLNLLIHLIYFLIQNLFLSILNNKILKCYILTIHIFVKIFYFLFIMPHQYYLIISKLQFFLIKFSFMNFEISIDAFIK